MLRYLLTRFGCGKMCSEINKILPVISETEYEVIEEGSTKIEFPSGMKIFYNPVQEFNRDLSISVLKVASAQYAAQAKKEANDSFKILEAFSASGLRSIRYAKEVPNITEVIANDIAPSAVEIIERNIKLNGVANIVKSSCSDAVEVMMKHRHKTKKFNSIDIDPYGSPVEFLDTAVQSVENGGILMITCTDMGVLCGNRPEAGFAKYGAVPLKNKCCHEMALRIALHSLQSHAAKYKRYIVPVLSISVDFYIRLFVKLYTSALECKKNISKTAMVYSCTYCHSTHLSPLGTIHETNKMIFPLPAAPVVTKECPVCGGKQNMGGPMWSAPIHDPDFVREVLNVVEASNYKTKSHLMGILNVILEELNDVPLYYVPHKLCSSVKATAIPMAKLRSAILNGGYRVSYSHACKDSVKTDAPLSFVWDILREWVKKEEVNFDPEMENGPMRRILTTECTNKIDFSLRPDAEPFSKKNRLLRFPNNPPYWGPGTKSQINIIKPDKKVKNQNRKRRRALEASGDGASDPKKASREAEPLQENNME